MDTQAELWFIKDLPKYAIEKPYKAFKELQAKDDPSNTNLEYEGRQQLIKDVRGQEHFFSLGEQGFTFQNWDNVPSLDWTIEGEITGMYLPAVKNFLAETLQREGSIVIKKMKVFDWRLRSAFSPSLLSDIVRDPMTKIKPATTVHVDQSPLGVLDRLRVSLGEETANELIKKYRVQIINVWRPLVDVVQNYSLAVCDARTAKESDLLEVTIIVPNSPTLKTRRSYLTKYSPELQFYYLSRMTSHEVCLLKIFDSAKLEGACVPHTAFKQTDEFSRRESIEVRVAVFSER